ncbi:hypothetical protein [Photorhabdus heterorhabditis]|uniref:hypothetical protein n=1 Tax=Photorhabdus heterorhabditis TaxID=880156 RepID=UPI0020B770AA|nr:hypothetical protein [Photorhabdus heterorhabditis]
MGNCYRRIVTAELFPRLVDKARENWALENSIFNLGCRGYVGKPGGERANYLTWVRDLANGEYIPVIFQVASLLAALTHPSHIVCYAPGDSLPCRRDAS